jgi:N-acetylglucosaminyl-diphospho-decaprenol L-rhamnosyltransferase
VRYSAVIVNYDSWPYTLRCIEALEESGGDELEVIVVDNEGGSAPELPAGVRLVPAPENLGFGRAANRGMEAAGGDLIVLINPDSLVGPGFFERVRGCFEQRPEVGIAAPKVLDSDGELQLSARREVGPLSGILGRTSLLTRLFPESPAVRRMFPALRELVEPTPVDWVSGACMVLKREALEQVGGFDERFFMYFEDADLCRRMRGMGWLVCYLPELEVTHLTGKSTRSKPLALWRLHKSAFLYHRKHGRHGPLNIYSAAVLLGLGFRFLAKLGFGVVSDQLSAISSKRKSAR